MGWSYTLLALSISKTRPLLGSLWEQASPSPQVQEPLPRALGLRLRLHFGEKLRKSKNEQHWREEAKARKVKRDRGEVLSSGPYRVTLAHRQEDDVSGTQLERVAGIPFPLASPPSRPASPFQLNTFATLSIY